jgi:hypothetical protein
MLVVRSEMKGLREHFAKQFPSYLRIVRDPSCRGKVQADFCTPEGDLVRGRVYRRFYGEEGSKKHSTMRWQHVGGWKLLKRCRKGSLFPSDVPLYAVAKYPQADLPNTMVEVGRSTVELAAMQHNTPLDPTHAQPAGEAEELTREALKAREKADRFRQNQEAVDRKLEEIFGTKLAAAPRDVLAEVDSRREIAAEEWMDAVARAKRRVGKITAKAVPFAARIRKSKQAIVMKKKKAVDKGRQKFYRTRQD